MWPPSSPDCNPLDYYEYGACERNITRSPHNTVASMKKANVDGFAAMMTRAYSRIKSRIEAVIEAEGNFIK